MIFSILKRLCLAYTDPLEEKEYLELKRPLNTSFSTNLVFGIALLSIMATVYFFMLGLVLDSYLALALNIFGILALLFKKKLGNYMCHFSLIYICFLATNTLVHMPVVLSGSTTKDAFYMGYSFALMTKLVDFRVNKFYIALILHVIFITARSLVIVPETIPQGILTTSLDVLPIFLSFNAEKAERFIFDLTYKTKNLLLKFKQLLTEYPNPIAVLTSDYSQALFVNNVFKKVFAKYDYTNINDIINNLVVDKQQNTDENRSLLAKIISLNYDSEDCQRVKLSDILQLLRQNRWIFGSSPVISFQVTEQVEETVEDVSPQKTPGKSPKKTINPSPKTLPFKSLKVPVFNFSRQVLKPEDNSETEKSPLEVNKKDMDATTTTPFITPKNESSSKYKHIPNAKEVSPTRLRESNRIFKLKMFLITWDDQEAVAILLDDVTYERTIMELKIADKNKDLVIAMVSHELRTPINGMLGLLEMMQKATVQPEVMIYLNACKASSRLLLNLVDSILDFSQIKHNKLKLTYSRVVISDLLAEIRSLFDHFCHMKGLFLIIESDPDVPQVFITDQTRLTQIIINLVGNAFKFTVKGGVKIKVSLTQSTPNRVKFTVVDTGIGIKKEIQEKLLKLFGRLEQHEKKVNAQGVLLGLTIANDLAILLNSNQKKGIQVESEIGKGTTISFCIQLETRDKLGEAPTEKNGDEESSFESIDGPSLTAIDRIPTHSELVSKLPMLSSLQVNSRNLIPQYSSSSINNIKCPNVQLAVPKPNETKILIESLIKREVNKSPWCLVVDDNPFNLMIAINTMKEKGFQVKTALTGQEAINTVKEHNKNAEPIKVILMDCQMPVMDGYETASILTKMMRDGEIEKCHIIALTANNQDKEQEKLCKDAGMSGCVQKPLNAKELDEVLQRLGRFTESMFKG